MNNKEKKKTATFLISEETLLRFEQFAQAMAINKSQWIDNTINAEIDYMEQIMNTKWGLKNKNK